MPFHPVTHIWDAGTTLTQNENWENRGVQTVLVSTDAPTGDSDDGGHVVAPGASIPLNSGDTAYTRTQYGGTSRLWRGKA